MTASILKSIAAGFTSQAILNYISRRNPQATPYINAARRAGFRPESILRQAVEPNGNPEDDERYLTDSEKIDRRRSQQKKKATLGLVGLVGTAGALAAGSYAYATRNQAIQPSAILPPLPQGQGPQRPPGQLPVPQQQGLLPYNPQGRPNNPRGPQNPNIPMLPQGGNAPQQAQNAPMITPYEPDPEFSIRLIKNINEDKRIGKVISSGLELPAIEQLVRDQLPQSKIRILEKAPGGLEQVLKDYTQVMRQEVEGKSREQGMQKFNEKINKPKVGVEEYDRFMKAYYPEEYEQQLRSQGRKEISPKEHEKNELIPQAQEKEIKPQELPQHGKNPLIQSPANIIREEQNVIQKQKPISQEVVPPQKEFLKQHILPQNIVITPIGAGELKHEGEKGDIVEVGGKQKSFFKDEIQKPEEELMQAVQNILNIPEVDRSSNIALFLYNPKDAEMYFQFHDGSAYKYYGIDPDKVFRLANKMAIPITQGQNVYGAWSQEDRNSLGAAFYQEILKDPKYKKPGKGEPPNPNYQKLDTLYDYWEKLRKKTKRKAKKTS